MAYRVPRHPRIEHHAKHQTRLARLTGLVLLWILVAIMALLAERTIPSQHAPWKALRVVDPVGMATRIKAARSGRDPKLCRAILAKAGLTYRDLPDKTEGDFCVVRDALRIESGMAPLIPADATMVCKEALALSIWERQVVQPAAYELLGQGVTGLEHYGAYSCRRMYGKPDGPVSEHAWPTPSTWPASSWRTAAGSWWRPTGPILAPRGSFCAACVTEPARCS